MRSSFCPHDSAIRRSSSRARRKHPCRPSEHAERLPRLRQRLPGLRVVAPGDRRAPRCARAALRIVQWAPPLSAPSSSHAQGTETPRPGPRARRPGAGGGRAEAVAQVVDEDPCRRGSSARSWRRSARESSSAMCSTIAFASALTVSQSSFGVIGTTTCRPLPPLVLRKLARPSSLEQRARQLGAFLHLRASATPSPGSRSNTIRSGCVVSRRRRVPGVELDHVGLRRADQRGERVDLDHRLVVGRDRRVELRAARGCCSVSACFWKNSWPPMPAGARTSETGRLTRCGRISRATVEVVVDDVELGDAGRGVDDAIGVADADAFDLASPLPLRGRPLRCGAAVRRSTSRRRLCAA